MKHAGRMKRSKTWLLWLAASSLLASLAWAEDAANPNEESHSAAATIKTWESAEERLTLLLDQVPPQARSGIERALEANREGRQKAQDALSRGDEQRAQRALKTAAAHAEIGLNQARAKVPASVLPRLDEAATQMSIRRGPTIAGLKSAPSVDVKPVTRPSSERPGFQAPDSMNRPATPARPPQRPNGPN